MVIATLLKGFVSSPAVNSNRVHSEAVQQSSLACQTGREVVSVSGCAHLCCSQLCCKDAAEAAATSNLQDLLANNYGRVLEQLPACMAFQLKVYTGSVK